MVSLFLVASSARATVITLPPGVSPGDSYRLAFRTSGAINATSTNIAVYNNFVSAVASAVPELASLGVGWKAIASTASVDARTNTGTDPTSAGNTGVPIFLLNGVKIADHYDDLWDGTLDVGIGLTELEVSTGGFVWTGTRQDGTAFGGLELGGGSFSSGRVGLAGNTGASWVSNSTNPRLGPLAFYAISDVIATVAVPEPTTLYLIGIGIAAAVALRSRR